MTMHVILGDGELPAKELEAILGDMRSKAHKADDPFWFLIQGKAEPSATDQAIVKWLIANDVYYEMITDGSEADIYTAYQNKYVVKRLAPKVVTLMQETPEEGESARMLALFASDDPDAEEDRWLNDVMQAVTDAGFTVLAMNDGMQEVKIVTTDDEDEEEAEPAPAPTKKAAAAKKAAAPAPAEEQGDAPAATGYTREELEELDLDGLKAVAAKLGITLPPRTRMPTYIEAILGNAKDTEVEVTEVEIEPTATTMQITTSGIGVTTGNTASTVYISNQQIAAPAMLIVVYNGTVVSRTISEDEARKLVSL